MLDCNIIDVVVFDIGCRFDLDQPPAVIWTTVEHIDSDENAPVLERTLEDRRDFRIFD